MPSSPLHSHTSSHTFGHHPATVNGWLGASGTQDLRALRLWQSSRQWRAVPWSCIDAAPGCRFLAAALVRQHTDGVARASSAGTKSGSSARSLVLLTMLAPVSRCAQLGDQLYSSTTKRTRKSPTEVRWAAAFATLLPSAICQLSASARHS